MPSIGIDCDVDDRRAVAPGAQLLPDEDAGRLVLDPLADRTRPAHVGEIEHAAQGIGGGGVGGFLVALADPVEHLEGGGLARRAACPCRSALRLASPGDRWRFPLLPASTCSHLLPVCESWMTMPARYSASPGQSIGRNAGRRRQGVPPAVGGDHKSEPRTRVRGLSHPLRGGFGLARARSNNHILRRHVPVSATGRLAERAGWSKKRTCAEGIRTHNPRFRRPMLCPVELRALAR